MKDFNKILKNVSSYVTAIFVIALAIDFVLIPVRELNTGLFFLLFTIVLSILWIFIMFLFLLDPETEA